MLALTEQGKTEHLAAVSALVRAKVPADEQAAIERFLAEYYRQVDPDDLAELEPADIYGAALSHLAFARRRDSRSPQGARLQSEHRGARLAVDAHRGPDRQRRHAVPGGLGDDGGESSQPRLASHRPPGREEPARSGGAAGGSGHDRRRCGTRILHARGDRPHPRRGDDGGTGGRSRAGAERRAACRRRLARDARARCGHHR